MRILHLTTEFPWPEASGGLVRTASQLRLLASLPEVEAITVVCGAERPVPAMDRHALEAALGGPARVRVVPVFHPAHVFDFKRYLWRVAFLRAVRGVPYLAAKWDSRPLRRAVEGALGDGPTDLTYIDHLGMAQYLPEVRYLRPTCRVVLDQHNVESEFFAQFAARQRGPRRLMAEAEWRASARFERAMLREADGVIAISHADAERFHELAGVRAHVVPMVIEPDRVSRRPSGLAARNLCYVGNLRWHPNVAGLDWFCTVVWPMIRARVPDVTLEIAGVGLPVDARGRAVVPRAWRAPGITTVGFLDNLEPLYARSVAMVAPVIGGSGVRVKLLEGFRAGMPVVTTIDGALGLPIADGEEALVAPSAVGFVERVERLLYDDLLRERIREGGYAYLEKHHSPAHAQAMMRAALAAVPTRFASSPRPGGQRRAGRSRLSAVVPLLAPRATGRSPART
ncbi:MAG: glycosyltransferase [Labilithrix sp.]|nr:glycosyltransferase [Labilithrix sp.]